MPNRVTTAQTGAPADTAISALTPAQVAIYGVLQVDYGFDRDDFVRERDDVAAIHKWVLDHITRENLDVIATSTSLHETLRRLKARCQPTDEAKTVERLELKMQWQHLMNSTPKSQDPFKILDKIVTLYQQLVREGLFDDPTKPNPDKMPLIETLNLLERMDPVYADAKRCGMHNPGYFIKSVPDLVTDYRNVIYTRPLRSRRQKGSFAFDTY